jgi:hypothetical protein
MAGCAERLGIRDALDQTYSRIPSLSYLGKPASEFPLTYQSDEATGDYNVRSAAGRAEHLELRSALDHVPKSTMHRQVDCIIDRFTRISLPSFRKLTYL